MHPLRVYPSAVALNDCDDLQPGFYRQFTPHLNDLSEVRWYFVFS